MFDVSEMSNDGKKWVTTTIATKRFVEIKLI